MKKQVFSLLLLPFLLTSCGEEPPKRNRVEAIVNTLGNDTISYRYLVSGVHHNYLGNTSTLSYSSEKQAKGALKIPFYPEAKVSHTDLSEKLRDRPTQTCGVNQLTLTQKVGDCASKNASSSKMIGSAEGNAGEGAWYLVTRTDDGSEVWFDTRTQMVWSDTIAKKKWCEAAGNASDDDGYDCLGDNGDRISICADNISYTVSAKGNLLNQVAWRLPTKSDWMTADINGIRLAIGDSGRDYWTATGSGSSKSKAWVYNGKTGASETQSRSTDNYIRCIGVVK